MASLSTVTNVKFYTLSSETVTTQQVVQEETYRYVTISGELKGTKHYKSSSRKAKLMLEFIARNFEYRKPEVILSLYNIQVRPYLEYTGLLITGDSELLESSATREKKNPSLKAQL